MLQLQEKIRALGWRLPRPGTPGGNYASRVQADDLLYISGQIAQQDGVPAFHGRLGGSSVFTIEDGIAAARSAALALLAQIDAAVDGDPDRVVQILRLGVFIACDPGFTDHSKVANGASDTLCAVFGERGRHVRTSVGVACLPQGVAVEVDAIVRITGQAR
jgi:enamine deaminase RidA (YjgF/YER057c/UK114 family)